MEENLKDKDEIKIHFVWNEAEKAALAQVKFAAYYHQKPLKEEAFKDMESTIQSILNDLNGKGFNICPENVAYTYSETYREGEKIDGNEIEIIYFQVPYKHIIYKCKGAKGVRFQVFENPENIKDTSELSARVSKFYNLFCERKVKWWRSLLCRFKEEKRVDVRKEYYGRLASGIHEYLQTNGKCTALLDDLIADVKTIRMKEESMKYVASYLSTLSAYFMLFVFIYAVLFLIGMEDWLKEKERFDFLCMAWIGAFGGLFSTLLAVLSDELFFLVRLDGPYAFNVEAGGYRFAVAVIASIFSCLAIKSNLFLGEFANNFYAMGVVAFAAGFSERFCVRIINKIGVAESHEKIDKTFGK